MKPETRNALFERFCELEQEIFDTKAKEYATEEDTLANFKTIAQIINMTTNLTETCPNCQKKVKITISPPIVALIYTLKHLLAILDYVGRKESLSESLESRILDLRVYAMLLYALFVEKEDVKS